MIKLILWAVLIIVAFPVFLGVGGGLLGLAAGVLGILTAVLVTLGATTFAVLLGGIVMLPYGVFHMFSHPLDGLMASGTGLILLGAVPAAWLYPYCFTGGSSLSLYEVS